MPDKDGYPTKKELGKISVWDINDLHGLMEYVEYLWHWEDYFERDGNTYTLHTGGWSGNEDIIGSLMSNQMFWMFNWYQSQRGGHYIFARHALEEEKEETT